MRIRIKNELPWVIAWMIANAALSILGLWPWVRVFVGLPSVLLFPGYSVTALTAPRRGDLRPIARLAISCGLSIIFFPLLDLALHYMPVGITVATSTLTLGGVTVIFTALAWWRRSSLPEADRFQIDFDLPLPEWRRATLAHRLLNVLIGVAGVLAVVAVGAAFLFPRLGELYTEFYVLGPQGTVLDYPRNVRVDAPSPVTLAVVNKEGKPMGYRVEASMDGQPVAPGLEMTLKENETGRRELSFAAPRVGDKQRIDFFLYRTGDREPYRSVYFWLNVKGAEEKFTEFFLSRSIETEALYLGSSLSLSTIVINHEARPVQYRLSLWEIQNRRRIPGPTFTLEPEQQWQGEVPFFLYAATNLVVHYELYLDDQPQPDATLRLYLEIRGAQ